MAELDGILTAHHKQHEFHTYDDAGHAYFAVDRPAYRVAAANDGWQRIATFFGTTSGTDHVHLHHDPRRRSQGVAKGPGSAWFQVTDATVYVDHPVHADGGAHAEHRLRQPGSRTAARVAVELTAHSARELLAAIQAALADAPVELTAP